MLLCVKLKLKDREMTNGDKWLYEQSVNNMSNILEKWYQLGYEQAIDDLTDCTKCQYFTANKYEQSLHCTSCARNCNDNFELKKETINEN